MPVRCPVVRLEHLTNHPHRAHLQTAIICDPGSPHTDPIAFDHHVIVGRHYEENNLGFFIPAGAIVPEKLLREMWLWNDNLCKGRLAGKNGNRVKARTQEQDGWWPSDGLFYGAYYWVHPVPGLSTRLDGPSWDPRWVLGDDVSAAVGITTGA